MDRQILLAIERLKQIERKGWVESGVENVESVADHSYAVAMMVLLEALDREDIDLGRALSMALIHDLAEVVVGDITPADGVPRNEKMARERRAMTEILSDAPPSSGKYLLGLMEELHEGRTPEARLVLEADVFERTVQAKIYDDMGFSVRRFFSALEEIEDTSLGTALGEFLDDENGGSGEGADQERP